MLLRACKVLQDAERLQTDALGLGAAEEGGKRLHKRASHDLILRVLNKRKALQQAEGCVEDLIAELEKDEAFTMEVRMRFEETVATLRKAAASEG